MGVAIRVVVALGCVLALISSLYVLERLTNGVGRDVVRMSIEFGVDHAIAPISALLVELE